MTPTQFLVAITLHIPHPIYIISILSRSHYNYNFHDGERRSQRELTWRVALLPLNLQPQLAQGSASGCIPDKRILEPSKIPLTTQFCTPQHNVWPPPLMPLNKTNYEQPSVILSTNTGAFFSPSPSPALMHFWEFRKGSIGQAHEMTN